MANNNYTPPIPAQKPDYQSTQGNERGFLDSLLSTVENVGNTAFNVSANYTRIKQMFDGERNPDTQTQGEIPNNVSGGTLGQQGGMTQTTLIGAAIGLLGLMMLLSDDD